MGIRMKIEHEATAEEREKVRQTIKKYGVTNYGNYNNLPTPLAAADAHDFLSKLFSYSPIATDRRQAVFDFDDGSYPRTKSFIVYWFHDEAFAITYDYESEEMLVIRIGCEHEYEELSRDTCAKRGIMHWGMNFHVYKCIHCEHILMQDSSG